MRQIEVRVIPRDADANRWYWISLFGFILRHRDAIIAGGPSMPARDTDEALEGFKRYGYELEILEHDLTWCINEFTFTSDILYARPGDLELKKFAVVYHADNFYVRVHKLIENIYRLLGQVVGLDPKRRPSAGDPSLRDQVRSALAKRKLQGIIQILRSFEENRWIQRAVEARNLFVHHYREEPEWPMLTPSRRFREPEDPMARDLRRIDQATDLDRYALRKAAGLSRTLREIRRFRDRLFDFLHDEYRRLLPAGEARTQK